MQPQRAMDLNNLRCSSSSATGAEIYRADSVIAPSGTDCTAARICEDGTIQVNDLMRGTLNRLANLTNLGTNWDGEGARPVSVFTLANAIGLFPDIVCEFYREVERAVCPYDVAPMTDGGIVLEWRGEGGTLELEVHQGRKFSYLLIEDGGDEKHFEESENISRREIIPLLSRIFRPRRER